MGAVRLGIVFGGGTEEHAISVKSARNVAAVLDASAYEPYWIGIAPGGRWVWCEGPGEGWERSDRPAVLSPDRADRGLLLGEAGGPRRIRLDVLLPLLHGRLGEDGAIQGLAELADIPYIGCGIPASAVCMDKSLTYLVAAAAGIRTPEHRVVVAGETVAADTLTYPVFVKPAGSGSSFGVSRVETAAGFAAALADARRYDTRVLVEQAVAGREVGCAILEQDAGLVLGELDRVAVTHGFFRIHQEAHPEAGSDNSTFVVPADITPDEAASVRSAARTIFRALGCRGLARVDLFLTEAGEVILNEVNTMPGLTSYSRYPRMMAAAGLPLAEVIDRLVAFTLSGGRR